MSFFARPNLDNEQFKQLAGTTLSLSGQTNIMTVTGLTLADGAGKQVIITVENASAHVGDVMTFTCVGGIGKVELLPSGSAGDIIYNKKSPTTCTVGGLTCGSPISGCTITDILEKILVPSLNPTLSPNSYSFTLSPSVSQYEVGTKISLSAIGTYNRGSVSPVYCGGTSYRTGLPSAYNYTTFGITCTDPSTSLSKTTTLVSNYSVVEGNNLVSGYVSYSAGDYAKDSEGNNYGTCCPACGTFPNPAVQKTITGILPWFWGKSATVPVIGQALINSGNKCVAVSSDSIMVDNYNATGEYIWFAIPYCASWTKTKWQGANSAENKGTIPAAGGLFQSAPSTAIINSPSSCWNGKTYQFYVSSYPTSVNYGMTYKL